MLKVILADDEEIIREGIYYSIDWEELGFTVVGQAEDGEEAIRLVEETKPDVIITDISMPFVNGLDFIEQINDKYSNAYIIIISGYDEFKYAQRALKLGVYEYILKPLDPDYLKELLGKIKLDRINKVEQELKNETLMKVQFLRDVIYERLEEAEILDKLESFSIDANSFFSVMIMQLDNCGTNGENSKGYAAKTLEKNLYELIVEIRKSYNEVFAFYENDKYQYVICLYSKHKSGLKRICEEISSKLREKIKEYIKCTVTISVGNNINDMKMLTNSYIQAVEALVYKFILGVDKNIYYENIVPLEKNAHKDLDNKDSEIIYGVKTGDKRLIQEKVKDLTYSIQSDGSYSRLYLQAITGSIYVQVLRMLRESGTEEYEAINNSLNVYKKIISNDTIEGTTNELLDFLLKATDYINDIKSGKFNHVIKKAQEYISRNYSDKDCSLENVARFVNVSTTYFSAIFKQQVGETFIDYLTRIRIEKAKELLSASAYKAYEISYMVGYNNPTYFSTTFKKYTGVSPSEYRGA